MRYCGQAGISTSHFLKNPEISNAYSWFENLQCYFTHKGRTAIRLGCELLGLHEGDEILAPSYNCGSEIDALLHVTSSVVLYRVDKAAQVDFEDLLWRVTARTKAVYVTHYFGFPQDISTLKQFCQDRGIYLIEDCALSLFSMCEETKIGMLGDIAIFSLPKTLPVPDGGVLAVNNSTLPPSWIKMNKPNIGRITNNLALLLKTDLLRNLSRKHFFNPLLSLLSKQNNKSNHTNLTAINAISTMSDGSYYHDCYTNRQGSKITQYISRRFNVHNIIEARQRNYCYFLELLGNEKRLTILYNRLPNNVCPLYFPLIVKHRNIIYHKLRHNLIAVIPWWSGYHAGINWEDFPDACYLKDRVIALPIHCDLTKEDIQYIAEQLISALDELD